MAETSATLTTWAPRVRSILRIMTGLLLLQHGTMKYFNFPPSDYFAGGLDNLMKVAGGIELIGGVAHHHRLVDAAGRVHLQRLHGGGLFHGSCAGAASSRLINGGDWRSCICFVFLYFVFAGPGPWSVDGARGKA